MGNRADSKPGRSDGNGGATASRSTRRKGNRGTETMRTERPSANRSAVEQTDLEEHWVIHMANSLRVGDSVGARTPAAPVARYPTDSGTRLLGPSRTTITRAVPVRRYA